MNYNLFLIDEVSLFLNKTGRYKSKILAFFRELKDNPFLESHLQETDTFGTIFDIYIIGKFAIYYFVDHANKEIKVLDLVSADYQP